MKPISSSITAAFIAAVATLGIVPQALAGGSAITTPGSACAFQGTPTLEALQAITIGQTGVSNKDPQFARDVVCPVVRSGEGGKLVIFVDGEAGPGAASISCRVQSRKINGDLLAQKSFTTTSANFDIPVPLDFAEAPQFSYQVAICRLPPNNQGRIVGVSALEF
jgi:hypothetical protein